MKKALIIIGLCLLAGYLIFAAFYFQDKPKDGICSKFEVVVGNNESEQFINTEEIAKFVAEKGLNPEGKQLSEVNTNEIEEIIRSNPLIKKAEVFTTNNSTVKAVIYERKPVLRVISSNGQNYYVDDEATIMPLSQRFAAYLPIATGAIKEDFAKGDLYKFALFLRNDEFWNAQIEQIVVAPNNDITLIPRVGDQQIILGKLTDYKEKLDKLMTFYQKGLNETGWNKYSVINLKYDKQVVGTKR